MRPLFRQSLAVILCIGQLSASSANAFKLSQTPAGADRHSALFFSEALNPAGLIPYLRTYQPLRRAVTIQTVPAVLATLVTWKLWGHTQGLATGSQFSSVPARGLFLFALFGGWTDPQSDDAPEIHADPTDRSSSDASPSALEHLEKAQAHFFARDYANAEKVVLEALEINPKLAAAHHLRAQIFARQRLWKEASNAEGRALRFDPDNQTYYRASAKYLNKARRWSALERLLRKTIQKYPDDAVALEQLSNFFRLQKDIDEAIRLGQRAVESGGGAQAAFTYAKALLAGNRPYSALNVLDVALKTSPTDARLLQLMVVAQLVVGRPREAVESARKVLVIQRDDNTFIQQLAFNFRKAKLSDAAQDALLQALEVGPADPDLRALLAFSFIEEFKFRRARLQLEQLELEHPGETYWTNVIDRARRQLEKKTRPKLSMWLVYRPLEILFVWGVERLSGQPLTPDLKAETEDHARAVGTIIEEGRNFIWLALEPMGLGTPVGLAVALAINGFFAAAHLIRPESEDTSSPLLETLARTVEAFGLTLVFAATKSSLEHIAPFGPTWAVSYSIPLAMSSLAHLGLNEGANWLRQKLSTLVRFARTPADLRPRTLPGGSSQNVAPRAPSESPEIHALRSAA